MTGRLSTATLAVLALCISLVLWFPLLTIDAPRSINYNEGWNAYRQAMAIAGRPLYAAPPGLWITNYPFLSFHLVGALGAAIGNVLLAGRIVSLASAAALAGLAGAIVRTLSGSPRAGLYAGFCLLLWIATFTPERRAMNDPELLGAAIAALGLFAAVRTSESPRWLALSALAFAAAVFVKQDLIALPLAVAADLLLTGRIRALALWTATGLAAACLLLALTDTLDGPFFLAHLLRPRAYLAGNLATNVAKYALHFALPLALCILSLTRLQVIAHRRFLLTLLLTTHLVSVLLSGGDGVASNIFYPSLLALAAASGVIPAATLGRTHGRRTFAASLLVPALAGAVFVPFQFDKDLTAWRNLPAATRSARHVIAELGSVQGPALCEDILLCFDAGKPIGPDPFFVGDQISTGRLAQADILALLTAHRLVAIELDGHVSATPAATRRRFNAAFMQTLWAAYRLVYSDGFHAVFEPR